MNGPRWLLFVILAIATSYGLIQWWDRRGQKQLMQIQTPLGEGRTVKSGDILLFSSPGFSRGWKPNSSLIVKLTSLSPISHIGMIWMHPVERRPYVWEISQLASRERSLLFKRERRQKSVQLVPLEDRLASYKGPILWRALNQRVDEEKLMVLIRKSLGQEYNLDLAVRYYQRLLGSIPLEFLRDPPNPQLTICSELIAQAYIDLGILDARFRPAGDYLPKDFHSPTQSLPFLYSHVLYPEVKLI